MSENSSIKLRQKRGDILDRLRKVVDAAERANRDLTPSERQRYETGRAEFDSLTEQIERAEAIETRDLQMVTAIPFDDTGNQRAYKVNRSSKKGNRTMTNTDRDMWLPSLPEYRNLRATNTTSAAAFIPEHQSETWHDRIRARSVVLQSEPSIFDMTGATLDIPKLTDSISVATVAEGDDIPTSDLETDSVRLEPSKLAAFTAATEEALDDSNPDLRDVIQTDLERSFAGELDKQLLVGDGTGTNMTGIRNFSDATIMEPFGGPDGGTPTLDELADMLAEAEAALELDAGNPEDVAPLVWFMNSRVYNLIRKLKDGTDRYQLSPSPGMEARKQLFGITVRTSSRLSLEETTGANSDTSPVILADMSRIAVGKRKDLEVKFSEDFYFDSDKVAVRVIGRYGIQPLNPEAVTIRPGARAVEEPAE